MRDNDDALGAFSLSLSIFIREVKKEITPAAFTAMVWMHVIAICSLLK